MPEVPYEEHREREILFRVITLATSSLDVQELLDEFVSLLSEAIASEVCFIYLLDRREGDLVLRAAPSAYAGSVGRVRLRQGEGVVGWAAERREAVLLDRDPMGDPRYRYFPELEGEKFSAMLSVPLLPRSGHLLGVVNAHSTSPGGFTDDDMRFVEHASGIIAGAVENAELLFLARQKERALADLVRKTIEVQEEERRRVATEIHDGVTQQLVSVWFRMHAAQRSLERGSIADALSEIEAAKGLVDHTLAEARSAIYNLRPATLDDLGLVASLHALTSRFTNETGVTARVNAPSELRLTPHLETALYRIAQEALSNVRKHASAASVLVSLSVAGGEVRLTVTDDGQGFDAERTLGSRPSTSFGLAGMRERTELIGGRLSISSTPDRGTTLQVVVGLDAIIEVPA